MQDSCTSDDENCGFEPLTMTADNVKEEEIPMVLTPKIEAKVESVDKLLETTDPVSAADPSKYIIHSISESIWEDEKKKLQNEIERLTSQLSEPPVKVEKPKPKKKKTSTKSKASKRTRKDQLDPLDVSNHRAMLMSKFLEENNKQRFATTVADGYNPVMAPVPMMPMPPPVQRYYPGDPRDPRNREPAYYPPPPPTHYYDRMYK